ncbi:DUF1223 domain-containing protein [Reinekea blandensis]|uniref:Uncharacterized secreted protein n=1 Tax=Reinekea blandensis MED297 TaxID=314283 RepID=A4BAX0_9GAMM|nr:DUF1223 domain-containing protein [Reinekea blandensis]EAR10583.1 uncharacterized secreted protein [Reinekea sp. MED297] [Reinekea blandensis MED297]
MRRLTLLTVWLLCTAMKTLGEERHIFESSVEKTQVIELYTSEGCSSCPPADRWLSGYRDHPELFRGILPLAFHVDYWNWLGWQDPFSHTRYTGRQQAYAETKRLSQVYTPGILINSREWRAWFSGQREWPRDTESPGKLSVELSTDGQIRATFPTEMTMNFHVAVLGMGLSNRIGNGENRGKTLTHDFVVLHWQQAVGEPPWELTMPDLTTLPTGDKTAVAFWVSEPDKVAIVQATGGYLP